MHRMAARLAHRVGLAGLAAPLNGDLVSAAVHGQGAGLRASNEARRPLILASGASPRADSNSGPTPSSSEVPSGGASATGVTSLGVIGGGQMGSGIAQVAAAAGIQVCLIDRSQEQLSKAKDGVLASLSRLAAKGKLQEAPATIMERLSVSDEIEALHSADFVIEAVPEDESLKISILRAAHAAAPAHAILASNTSSISITRLAAATRPASCIGMHFMNPVPLMPLVEVIRGMTTSEATYAAALALAARLRKQTCVSLDRPGFIVNRILMPMINEAFYALMEGVASAEDIDLGMRLGTNQPMGPLTLADFIGLDTCLSIMRVLHQQLGDGKYRPCPLLVQYVDAQRLGRKTGRGVYVYS